jgi:hypothetical protein
MLSKGRSRYARSKSGGFIAQVVRLGTKMPINPAVSLGLCGPVLRRLFQLGHFALDPLPSSQMEDEVH